LVPLEKAFSADRSAWTIIPGNPDESELLRRVVLPIDDLDYMPARGRGLTTSEIALVRRWIAGGAGRPESDRSRSAPTQGRDRPSGDSPRSSDPSIGIEIIDAVPYATWTDEHGKEHDLLMDVASPPATAHGAAPAILVLHGGGWVQGDRKDVRAFLSPLAQAGYVAAAVSYRLAPRHPWPAAGADVRAAVRFIHAHAEELGVDPDRIGLMGFSAGGHLAALAAVSANASSFPGELPAHSDASSSVAAVVVIGGLGDLTLVDTPSGERLLAVFLGSTGSRLLRKAREASPVTWLDSDDPPILIVHGEDDPIVPAKHAMAFHQALLDAGVDVTIKVIPGQGHMPAPGADGGAAARFLDAHLGGLLAR